VPLKHPERYLRTGLKHRLRYAAVKRATRVIVPTRPVLVDCERLLGMDPGRIVVVPEATAPVFRRVNDPAAQLERLNLPKEFLLWVGGLDPPDPRKRVADLAAAVARGDGLPLVLAGRASTGAQSLAVRGRVQLTGRVSDEDLAALYSAAAALVLPSDEEGFGLPVLEALACGTPVAAFAIDSLRELYGENPDVSLADPGDIDGLLATAETLVGRVAAPPRRTWADVANETWAVYSASSMTSD
jgi:glycosyltransferase involved in cell wall biosynthesis